MLRGYVVASGRKSAVIFVTADGILRVYGGWLDGRRDSGSFGYVLEVLDEENPE